MDADEVLASSAAASASTAAGGASPFAAAPPPRTSLDAATAAAAGTGTTAIAAPAALASAVPASSNGFALSAAEAEAGVVADQATAQLPPRPSICRNDSLARAGSLALRPVQQANIGVFGWGRNDCGQLGFPPDQGSRSCSSCSSSSSPAPGPAGVVAAVIRLPVLEGRVVVSAAASLFNTALLTADGELYLLGSNDSGLLGRRPKPAADSSSSDAAAADYSWSPVRLEALEPYPLADVALGQDHAVAVTQQGLLASWGLNESGQLGTGTTSDKPQHNPKLIKGSATATSPAADGSTAAAKRFAAGSGSSSSPGPGGSSSSRVAFVRCAVGGAHSAVLSSSGRCFTFGQGIHGELGVPSLDSCPSPMHVSGLWEVGVLQVCAGEAHCAVLGANGYAYTWGRGKYGQLGHGSYADQHTPKQITSVSSVTCIVAGDHHTLLLAEHADTNSSSSSLQAYGFGRGTFGATGLGSTDNVCRPSSISALQGKHIVQLAAGRQHSVALSAAGQIYAWGDGQLGQLGLGCCCSSSRDRHEHGAQQQQQQQHGGSSSGWLLPSAQVSPKQLQQLPWPASCPVLFIAAGGDHTIAVVQLTDSSSSSDMHAAVERASLDMIMEDVVSSTQAAPAPPWVSAEEAAAHKKMDEQQQQQSSHPIAMETDGNVSQQQQQQQEQHDAFACPPHAAVSGPDPLLRPYGSTLVPLQPPPLLQLATAAAAEAAASRRAAGMTSPDPGSSSSSGNSNHAAVDSPGGPGRSAAAAARDDHAAAASSAARPSAVVVDLAHTVLDVFSSPGLLLLLFKASSKDKLQQQQQHSSDKQQPADSSSPASRKQQQQQLVPDHGLDLDCIESTYTLLLKSYAREVVGALGAACVRLLQELPDTQLWLTGSSSEEVVCLLFILLQNPLNSDAHGLGSVLLGLLTALVLKLSAGSMRLLLSWLTQLKPEVFGARVVRPVQALLTRLAREAGQSAGVPSHLPAGAKAPRPGLGQARGDVLLLARLLDVLHAANVQAGELVPFSEFANAAVSDTAVLHEEYYTWLHSGAYRVQYEVFQQAAGRATSAEAAGEAAAAAAGAFSSIHEQPAAAQLLHEQLQQQRQQRGQQQQHSPGGRTGGLHGMLSSAAGVPGGPISSLCEVPFLLSTEAKSFILRDEAALQQQHVVHASAMAALLQGLPPGGIAAAGGAAGAGGGYAAAGSAGDPLALALSLKVRRGHEMQDALQQIRNCGPQELKKPLRVTFLSEDGKIAEEGVDQGGVSREFFQILVGQLFNPDYGMFLYVQESRSCWFNPASLESLAEFELVGIVLGLACYNGIILDAHLPLVAYKKLMGLVPTVEDLALLYPALHGGLQQLLDFEGDVETTFCRNFEVEYEAFGETRTVELVPGGSSKPVTADNRAHFVALYTAWLLTGSVAEQFAAFASGFHRVCGGPALSLFRYEEVELLVEGLPHLDFRELQAGARYEGGYSAAHPTITALWAVLHALPIDEKRAFLQFCTGCDRAPVAGLAALRLLIQRGGPDSNKLPTAHTCFNALLLPEYSSKAKLQQKLLTAIQNAHGFGLQ